MDNSVSWNLQLGVKPGKLDDFRVLMEEMVESTEHEEGAEAYEWYLSEDGALCHIYERYADSDATMVHLAAFGEHFAERFMECVTPLGFFVYGSPNATVRGALEGMSPKHLGPFGGFRR